MKARLTALLTLLLTVSAAFGVPVTTGVCLRASAAIVCEVRERRAVELKAAAKRPRPAALVTPSLADAPTILLPDHALFQRPPPAA